jgi:hypothetical protein
VLCALRAPDAIADKSARRASRARSALDRFMRRGSRREWSGDGAILLLYSLEAAAGELFMIDRG